MAVRSTAPSASALTAYVLTASPCVVLDGWRVRGAFNGVTVSNTALVRSLAERALCLLAFDGALLHFIKNIASTGSVPLLAATASRM